MSPYLRVGGMWGLAAASIARVAGVSSFDSIVLGFMVWMAVWDTLAILLAGWATGGKAGAPGARPGVDAHEPGAAVDSQRSEPGGRP